MKHQLAHARQDEMLTHMFGDTINRLLDDNDVLEVMVNPDGKVWAESFTQGKHFTETVLQPGQIKTIIQLIATQHDLVANADSPEIACEFAQKNARFQGWLPPVTKGPCFTIRKHLAHTLSLDEYVAEGAMSEAEKTLLLNAIMEKKNIIIAGGTGSGKTTLANTLLNHLPEHERVIIIEDLPELHCNVEDAVYLKTSHDKSMRDLVQGALRMRPDRIIIGEVRDGAAALDMLKAWNTGHPGGICTVHANRASSVVSRLEDLVREVLPTVPTHLIHNTVDLVVFIERTSAGSRKVHTLLDLKAS